MRILVTRPREDATLLAAKLKERGHSVVSEPMLEIRLAFGAKVDLTGAQAVLFTSANGVRAFAAAETRRDLPAFAVGDTTASAARSIGFARVESAGGNVGQLTQLVREKLKPSDGALVHAAGSDVAGDLSGNLQKAGFTVRRVVLYSAEPITALSPMIAAGLKSRHIDVAVFYSPRTAATFAKLIKEAKLEDALTKTVAVGLSHAVLEPIKDLPWAMMEAARRPEEADLLRAIARQKIIAQLEGAPAPATLTTDEVTFGRRAEDPVAPPAPKRRVLAGVMATLAVLLSLGTFALVMLENSRPVSDLGSSAALMRLETRLAGLERQLTNVARNATAPTPAPASDPSIEARLNRLAQQLSALEAQPTTQPAPPVPQSDDTAAQLEQMIARVDTLEKDLANRAEADQVSSALAENRRLAEELTRVQEDVARNSVAAERGADRGNLVLAIGQLAAAASRHGAVTAELATVRSLAGDDTRVQAAIERLQPYAARAVPSREALIARFPTIAGAAGRALRTVAVEPGSPWWSAWMHRLSSVVSIRRVGDIPGETAEARLARAEQRIAENDLAAAVTTLDGTSWAPVLAAWLDDAKARLAIDKVVDELLSIVLAGPVR